MTTEYRLVIDIDIQDVTFGVMTKTSVVATTADRNAALLLLEGAHSTPAGEGIYVQTRQVSEWATPEGPLDGPAQMPGDTA